jgi:hypothetical protein
MWRYVARSVAELPIITIPNFPVEEVMRHVRIRTISALLWLLGPLAMASHAYAAEDAQWLLQTSLYTKHFHTNPEHNDKQNLLGLEYQRADRWVVGASAFDNSFHQPSQYFYFGKLFRPLESAPLLHFKLTGGLLHGYKNEYRDKIPLNSLGVAPVIIPAIGLSGKHVSGEINFFGFAGVIVTMDVLF